MFAITPVNNALNYIPLVTKVGSAVASLFSYASTSIGAAFAAAPALTGTIVVGLGLYGSYKLAQVAKNHWPFHHSAPAATPDTSAVVKA